MNRAIKASQSTNYLPTTPRYLAAALGIQRQLLPWIFKLSLLALQGFVQPPSLSKHMPFLGL